MCLVLYPLHSSCAHFLYIPFLPTSLLPGNDFTLDASLPMTFVFEPDEQSKSLNISVIDDNLLENEEIFAFTLFQSTSIPDVDFAPSIVEVTLQDNEGDRLHVAA